jgi:hypothetical protein
VAFSVFAQVLLPILVVVGSGYLLQRRVKLEIHSVMTPLLTPLNAKHAETAGNRRQRNRLI